MFDKVRLFAARALFVAGAFLFQQMARKVEITFTHHIRIEGDDHSVYASHFCLS